MGLSKTSLSSVAAVAIASLLVSGCGMFGSDSISETQTAQSPIPGTPVAPAQKGAPPPPELAPQAEIKDSIEKAMGEIPPELRTPFQKAFACKVAEAAAAKNRDGRERPIDADFIRTLTAELKTNSGLGASCS